MAEEVALRNWDLQVATAGVGGADGWVLECVNNGEDDPVIGFDPGDDDNEPDFSDTTIGISTDPRSPCRGVGLGVNPPEADDTFGVSSSGRYQW